MKRIIAIIVLLSTLICCCACQPTPDVPPVVSKNDGKLEKALYEGAPEDYSYDAPEYISFDNEYAGGKAHITCDNAPVSVLKNGNYAVYSATYREFTSADFERIIDLCFPDAVVTKHLDTFSKQDIQQYMIVPLEKELWELENGEYVIPDVNISDEETGEAWSDGTIIKYTKQSTEQALDRARKKYESAPDAVTGEPFDITSYVTGNPLSLDLTLPDGTIGRIYYVPSTRRLDVSLGEYKIEHAHGESIGLTDLGDARIHREEDLKTITVSNEDALSYADAFVKDMGLSDEYAFSVYTHATAYTMARLMEVGSEWDYDRLEGVIYGNRKTYRGVAYTRKVDDVPCAEFCARSSAGEDYYSGNGFVYERFIVWVGDSGVVGFSWDYPLGAAPLQESVVLLPFDEIEKRVADSLYYSCAAGKTVERWVDEGGGYGHTEPFTYPLKELNANICELELRYMQVLRKDGGGSFLLIPVWCAYCDSGNSEYEGFHNGDTEYVNVIYMIAGGLYNVIEFTRDGYRQPAVVLSAIDGSIIALTQGY